MAYDERRGGESSLMLSQTWAGMHKQKATPLPSCAWLPSLAKRWIDALAGSREHCPRPMADAEERLVDVDTAELLAGPGIVPLWPPNSVVLAGGSPGRSYVRLCVVVLDRDTWGGHCGMAGRRSLAHWRRVRDETPQF